MKPRSRRIRLELCGTVQGVGFRPFVYRLARELCLAGHVRNTPAGATIEVEGAESALERFVERIEHDPPPQCRVKCLIQSDQPTTGDAEFLIQSSDRTGARTACMLPDLATCADCRRELFDSTNRRYRYPFINCTQCGPRFSIIEAIPYDRPNTTMKAFTLCQPCRTEYEDPGNRRFHAQPNACPACGPHVEQWDAAGAIVAQHDSALLAAADAIRSGAIVAVKGLGGFHLMVDARNEASVQRLRRRKARDEKPFALMFPSLDRVHAHCRLSAAEAHWLMSPQAPIVLLRRQAGRPGQNGIAASVAPDNPYLGVMLPYTPLHHLFMADLDFPVVSTSGNRSEEPIYTDECDALLGLKNIADLFLVHNRPIARPMEDSVVQVLLDNEQVLRAGRGFAPATVPLPRPLPPVLAVGGHLKNAVAIAVEDRAVVSQHVGDLETLEARAAFQRTLTDLPRLHALTPTHVVCDLHPDYTSTRAAEAMGLPLMRVQHHEAHVFACMAEHELTGDALGIAWDGTGYGADGTIWGGEFFAVGRTACRRVAFFRPFRLPGGEAAMREPRRAALGILFELFGHEAFARSDLPTMQSFSTNEKTVLAGALRNSIQAPATSSVGRLFDAVASLTGVRQLTSFEGQAAMDVQFAADAAAEDRGYSFALRADGMIDWEPVIRELLDDRCSRAAVPQIAARFHAALVGVIVKVAQRNGHRRVVLGGGCFQNRLLLEAAVRELRLAGFEAYWPQRIPPGDGGLALGQLAAWAADSGERLCASQCPDKS